MTVHNVKAEVKGTSLIITVANFNAAGVSAAPASKTGHSHLLASTGGFIELPSIGKIPASFSLNVCVKPNGR